MTARQAIVAIAAAILALGTLSAILNGFPDATAANTIPIVGPDSPALTATPTSFPTTPTLIEPADGVTLPQPVPPGAWLFEWIGPPTANTIGIDDPSGRSISNTLDSRTHYEYRYTRDEFLPDEALGPWTWSVCTIWQGDERCSTTRTFWVQAADQPASLTVCQEGPLECNHSTIQAAVDAAQTGDLIKVAAGLYADVQGRPAPSGYVGPSVITQAVYLSKTLTIRGGYTTTNGFAEPPDPEANPTIINAQRQGRVLFIVGPSINPTIEGLRMTGGDATELGGAHSEGDDAGGGVYLANTTAILNDNQLFDNASDFGGGAFLTASDVTLSANTVVSNTANQGGGLYLAGSNATLSDNTISGNTAHYIGGGLWLTGNTAQINDNTISHNTAAHWAGGVYVWSDLSRLKSNIILSNSADFGGGLFLWYAFEGLDSNTVMFNTANQHGGGLYLLNSNTLLSNTLIANNQAYGAGDGVYIAESHPRMLHTTLACNGSTPLTASASLSSTPGLSDDGSGVYVLQNSDVVLINTILVSHSVGITVAAGSRASLEATLWGKVGSAGLPNWGGPGTIVTGTVNLWGDPAFVDPAAGDYHIGSNSAALDHGVDVSMTHDIDGQPRPNGAGYDLGADEFLPLRYIYLPVVLK